MSSAADAPDRRRGHADATLIEASVTARLLGMRLLTLDAKITLVPADVTVAAPRATHRAAGHHGLADAVRDLNEGARLLADVQRRDGSEARRR